MSSATRTRITVPPWAGRAAGGRRGQTLPQHPALVGPSDGASGVGIQAAVSGSAWPRRSSTSPQSHCRPAVPAALSARRSSAGRHGALVARLPAVLGAWQQLVSHGSSRGSQGIGGSHWSRWTPFRGADRAGAGISSVLRGPYAPAAYR